MLLSIFEPFQRRMASWRALAIIFRELGSKLLIFWELGTKHCKDVSFWLRPQIPLIHINITVPFNFLAKIDFWLAFILATASISGSILAKDRNSFSKILGSMLGYIYGAGGKLYYFYGFREQ